MTELRSRAFVKRGGGLFPADALASEGLDKMKEGACYLINIHRPRNVMHHRKLFALLNIVLSNSDRWPTMECLLDDLKISTGLFETRVSAINGMPYPAPRSIAFASMAQDQFEEWFDRAVDLICREVLQMSRDDLMAELESILAGRAGVVFHDSERSAAA